jgi:hypothetical protein
MARSPSLHDEVQVADPKFLAVCEIGGEVAAEP